MNTISQKMEEIGLKINPNKTSKVGLAKRKTKQHKYWEPINILGTHITSGINPKKHLNQQIKLINKGLETICEEGQPLKWLNPRLITTFVESKVLSKLIILGYCENELIEKKNNCIQTIPHTYKSHKKDMGNAQISKQPLNLPHHGIKPS